VEYIDIDRLNKDLLSFKEKFQNQQPFHFIFINDFFKSDKAELLLHQYPSVEQYSWKGITYMNQKNKFELSDFHSLPVFQSVFDELNAQEFIEWLQKLTGIEEPLLGDKSLFGAGLHQSIDGAFLNVHVDYNIHPVTQFHRRLNVLIYLNKDWKDEYGGNIEFWDFADNKKKRIASFQPAFNSCVIFETNEYSYHGHPKPLSLPKGMSRKSISSYYYSEDRPKNEKAREHNTVFRNTEGVKERIRILKSGLVAFWERVFK
jgi:Rps23 Pro-64 3,4-dihydroxylase Tpa1-like proline 4-hydroxylase